LLIRRRHTGGNRYPAVKFNLKNWIPAFTGMTKCLPNYNSDGYKSNTMKLGIDAREIEDGVRTGIGRALSVFLDYFESRDDENTAFLFSTRPVERPDSPRVQKVVAPPAMTFIWDQVTLSRLIRNAHIDLFYSAYYKVPIGAPCPCVSTIYDLMYLTFPMYQKKFPLSLLFYKTFGRMLINKASRIITSSVYSRNEIAGFYQISPEKIISIPLGVPSSFCPSIPDRIQEVRRRLGIKRDYILYTGNFNPHKNVGGLIRSFSTVHDRFPDLLLVLSGYTENHTGAIATQIAAAGLQENVIITSTISDAEILSLYSGARLFVMPSLCEGFGYPPLEAMACGTPVVCSNAASLPEVVGDAAILVDANDHQAMAQAMIRILESPDLARTLSKKGLERAREFSGDIYATKVYDLLKEVELYK
jgi:glycosyltransferase involved in cell wall biosynthesis